MTLEEGIDFIRDRFKSAMVRVPVLVGNVAVNFTLDNFRRQGFLGNTLERWPGRKGGWKKDKRSNRNILINTGRLRRSIRVVRTSPTLVVIGTDLKYAKVHNEGFKMGLIQSVRSYTRKNGSSVSQHTRRIDQNIPRRRFMGNSPYLNAAIKRTVTAEFMKALK